MDEIIYISVAIICVVTVETLMPQHKMDTIDTETCCNGTMGYAALPMVPCSALQCCNESETVAIYPVNHAMGYKFMCMPKHAFTSSKCYTNGEEVTSTNRSSVTYIPKICCPRLKFDLRFNTNNVALSVFCTRR